MTKEHPMIEGLSAHRVECDGVGLATWSGGEGPAVVLLHGYPESSAMWRDVAPALLPDHRVILMDLRGYGDSDAPAPSKGDENYAKRTMAADVVAVLEALDIESAHVVGHDRGARVVHRLCLDHPEIVDTATVLDIVPTLHMYESVDRSMAESYFHWFFLTRGGGLPESLLRADPASWIRSRFAGRHAPGFAFPSAVVDEYAEAFARPGVIEATCSDYRAAAGIDLEHDRADREAGKRISSPLLVGWGRTSYVGRAFDVPAVWAAFADDLRTAPIDADHYVAEENPMQTISALRSFWAAA